MNNINKFKSFLDKNFSFYQENYQKTKIVDPFTGINTKNLKLETFLKNKYGSDIFPNNNYYCSVCCKTTKYSFFKQLNQCNSHSCRNYRRKQHIDRVKREKIKHDNRDKSQDYISKLTNIFYNFGKQSDTMKFSKELKNNNISINEYMLKYHINDIKFCQICSKILLANRKNPISIMNTDSKFCSHKCYHIDKKLNPDKYSLSLENRKKQSMLLKGKIKKGEFTPARNIYTHWKSYNSLTNTKYRSRWEYIFHLRNPTFLYEKVRIKYYDTVLNKERIYIIDFQDPETLDLYEVKPKSEKMKQNIIDKEIAVKQYCIDNSITFKYIDEDDIIKCYDYLVNNNSIIDEDLKKCAEQLKKQKLKK